MKTLIFLGANVITAPATKGDLAVMSPDGGFIDITDGNALATLTGRKGNLTLISALGNGSFRQFVFNPYNFKYTKSAYAAGSIGNIELTLPTGNVPSNEPFVGMIVVQQFDKDKNVLKTIETQEFTTTSTTWAAVKTALITQLDTFANLSGSAAAAPGITTIPDAENIQIQLTGSLNQIRVSKAASVLPVGKGTDVAKIEREWSVSQGNNPMFDTDSDSQAYAASNAVVDPALNYESVIITTQVASERPLHNGSQGLETECMIVANTAATGTNYDDLVAFLDAIMIDPSVGIVAAP